MSSRDKLLFLVIGFIIGISVSYFFFPFASVSAIAFFSPEDGQLIIDEINSAEKSIDAEIYLVTSEDVINALKRAHDRGVDIRIIMEKRVIANDNSDAYIILSSYGIPVRWASKDFQLTHSKFLIIDGKKVIVGSHNWSDSALKKNREASVIVENPNTVNVFQAIFEEDWGKD